MDTAVIWLQRALGRHLFQNQMNDFEGLFQQALDMEQQQIMDAWVDGLREMPANVDKPQDYYYSKFGKQDEDYSEWDVTLMDGLEDEPIEPF
jgi:hypothetical protein